MNIIQIYIKKEMQEGKAKCKIKPGRKLIHQVHIKHLIEESYRSGSELLRAKTKRGKEIFTSLHTSIRENFLCS